MPNAKGGGLISHIQPIIIGDFFEQGVDILVEAMLLSTDVLLCFVIYVGEKPWRPIQGPNYGRKKVGQVNRMNIYIYIY